MPVRIIFEHLEAGDSLDVFLRDLPSVGRELAIQVLEDAKTALVLDAHPVCRVGPQPHRPAIDGARGRDRSA